MVFDEISEIQRTQGIVGRRIEIGKALAALRADKHLLIEGTVGVGKTVLALAATRHLKKPFCRVDGDERYTEQKLTGWFDPPFVLKQGYSRDTFFDGPLTSSMKSGGVLFINELNRMPEGVQNVILPAMDERHIEIPKIGTIEAKAGFTIVATQNPREFVATSSLSEALRDRFELLTLEYQNREEEKEIVLRNVPEIDPSVIDLIISITRMTRTHPEVRRGASIRAAISISQLYLQLDGTLWKVIHEAAGMAIPTRIELKDDAKSTAQEVISEIVDASFSNLGISTEEKKDSLGASTEEKKDSESTADGHSSMRPTGVDQKSDSFGGQTDGFRAIHWTYTDMNGKSVGKTEIIEEQGVVVYTKRPRIRAIVQRVIDNLGPARTPTRKTMRPYSPDIAGELDIEETAERILGRQPTEYQNIIMETTEKKKTACSLMLDSSLSMSGDKLAMAAASIAVLAERMRTFDYSIVTFNNSGTVMKGQRSNIYMNSMLEKMLDIQGWGYTNIEDGLKKGLGELNKARALHKVGVIVTDGDYTMGKNPVRMATLFPRLHVVMMEDNDCKHSICRDMATAGKGKVFKIGDFDDLPKVLHQILNNAF